MAGLFDESHSMYKPKTHIVQTLTSLVSPVVCAVDKVRLVGCPSPSFSLYRSTHSRTTELCGKTHCASPQTKRDTRVFCRCTICVIHFVQKCRSIMLNGALLCSFVSLVASSIVKTNFV